MSLDTALPFAPGDRVICGADGPMATVQQCELRAECPGGIFMTVFYDRARVTSGTVAATWSPIPPREHLIRLAWVNPSLSPRCGVRQSHPAHATPACDAGSKRGAPSGEFTPSPGAMARPAPFRTDWPNDGGMS